MLFILLLAHSPLLVCVAGGQVSLPASRCGCWVVPLSLGWRQGHPALLHISPNLQIDLSLVFIGVVLWGVSCVVALVHSGLLRG